MGTMTDVFLREHRKWDLDRLTITIESITMKWPICTVGVGS